MRGSAWRAVDAVGLPRLRVGNVDSSLAIQREGLTEPFFGIVVLKAALRRGTDGARSVLLLDRYCLLAVA